MSLVTAALALALGTVSAAGRDKKPPMRQGLDRSYGILLLGEGGDRNWKSAVEELKREASRRGRALEFASGPADAKEVQKAAARLQDRGVKKIVAVPLYLSSFCDAVDEGRYLFGIREHPPTAFAAGLRRMGARQQPRVALKTPLVLTKALDDSEALVELLAARAREQSRDPAKETLVLAGELPSEPQAARDWMASIDVLAEKTRQKAGLKAAKGVGLSESGDHKSRDESERAARKLIAALASHGPVIVVPLELSSGVLRIRLPRVLEGVFARVDPKPLLPDDRLLEWVLASAEEASKLPDMRVYKSASTGFASAQTQTLNLTSPPPGKAGH